MKEKDILSKYRFTKGMKISDFDANDHSAFDGDKTDGKQAFDSLNNALAELQELLYAENKHKILIVLQGMDTSGKDGVIRHVFNGVNPQGVRVAAFKVPSLEELRYDYLWRVHEQTPGKGEMVIFNRSHYEDVLVVRVHKLVPPQVWKKRYDQIKNFECLLAEEGTTILKFFLHIDKEEQKQRLQQRLDDPQKRWKFNPGDLKERDLWDDYMAAYQDALRKTSTAWAPWYLIPANRKWYRNVLISEVLIRTLKGLKMKYPKPQWEKTEIDII
jgi:PPK2 family polyphosphate:nucleotide phosphotransferase